MRTEIIPRVGEATKPDDHETKQLRPADWAAVSDSLRKGPWPCWLSVTVDGAVHQRPVFAAWTGTSFVLASSPRARKTRGLRGGTRASLAIALDGLHVVVEGDPARLLAADLGRAVEAFRTAYDWPTEPAGDLLDAPFAAPTSGGPPFEVYEVHPARAYAFPTADQVEPTRFTWP